MSERNNWWMDDLEPEFVDSRHSRPSVLLHLDTEKPWLGLGDESEFGGHVIYAHPEIAVFLQRALRLREGRNPLTGESLPVDLETLLKSPLLSAGFFQQLLRDLINEPKKETA